MKPFSKILVPLDFSEHSDEAVRVAADLARHYAAPVDLINVYEPLQYLLPEGYVLFSPDQVSGLTTVLQERLARAEKAMKQLDVLRVESHLLQGVIAGEIVDYAKRQGVDLIVMGTHGRTGVKHAIMGSVAEKVVRTAACAVLTVKAAEAAK